jgi:hypothetical protein
VNPNSNIQMSGDNQTILIANEQDVRQEAIDVETAKFIGDALNAHYPGHLWAVNVQGAQGIATIHNLMLSGKWGCNMMLDKRFSSSDLKKKAIMLAGEILERYNVARGRADYDKMADMPLDRFGQVIGDLK